MADSPAPARQFTIYADPRENHILVIAATTFRLGVDHSCVFDDLPVQKEQDWGGLSTGLQQVALTRTLDGVDVVWIYLERITVKVADRQRVRSVMDRLRGVLVEQFQAEEVERDALPRPSTGSTT